MTTKNPAAVGITHVGSVLSDSSLSPEDGAVPFLLELVLFVGGGGGNIPEFDDGATGDGLLPVSGDGALKLLLGLPPVPGEGATGAGPGCNSFDDDGGVVFNDDELDGESPTCCSGDGAGK